MRQTLSQESYRKGSPASYEDSLRVLYGGSLDLYLYGIQFLLDQGASFENQRVLELCCGTGLASQEIISRRPLSFTGIDVIPSFVSFAEERIHHSLPLEQGVRFYCKDLFSHSDLKLYTSPVDMVILCNAATEIQDTSKLFSLAYQLLDSSQGVFLFNIKVKDKTKTVYEMVYDTLVRLHQENRILSKSQSLEGLRDGRVVSPEFEAEKVLSLLSEQGFRVQLCQKASLSFSALQLDYYISRTWTDYTSLLERIHVRSPDDRAMQRWVREQTEDMFPTFRKRCFSQFTDCSHMKTELFVRAEKGSSGSYSGLS